MASQDTIGYETLSADLNKPVSKMPEEAREGVVADKLPELKLEMSDEDIIKLTEKWEKAWLDSEPRASWIKKYEDNERYWLGNQHDLPEATKTRQQTDNLVFESLETYLPQATRRNPEPLVTLDAIEVIDDEQLALDPNAKMEVDRKERYVRKVKNRLADIADKNKLRLKLKKAARHWAIYLLGVAKISWDLEKDIPTAKIVRPPKLILDPESVIDEDGYSGRWLGEYRKLEASLLLDIVKGEDTEAEAKKKIEELTKGELGTDIQFIEWWTPQAMFWKLDKTVLLKRKNPHWNYDTEEKPAEASEEGGVVAPAEDAKQGINHLPVPDMPYVFMSVFNLGDQPMDKTSLIGQNLANQDRINKRTRQIDKNADDMNNGAVISLARSGLTQPQAKNVITAIRKGGAVLIPDGSPQDAVYFPQRPAMPADVYNDLTDTRNRMRDMFGTRGSNPAGIESEQTVRGKIMNRSLDTDRIGGGVSEYLEQFADDIYNWYAQMLYVYDTAFQFIEGAVPPKIVISVKEGSLLPKDSITIANQAIELATAGKMSLIDMYKRLEYPNPEEMAANVWLELNAPHLLYQHNPMVQQAIGMAQAMGQPQQPGQPQAQPETEMPQGGAEGAQPSGSILSQVPQGAVGPQP